MGGTPTPTYEYTAGGIQYEKVWIIPRLGVSVSNWAGAVTDSPSIEVYVQAARPVSGDVPVLTAAAVSSGIITSIAPFSRSGFAGYLDFIKLESAPLSTLRSGAWYNYIPSTYDNGSSYGATCRDPLNTGTPGLTAKVATVYLGTDYSYERAEQ